MSDKSGNLMVPNRGGALKDVVNRLKLIGRLMADGRVNMFLKVLPLASLAYLFWPLDFAPAITLPIIGALDDAAILWLGSYLFVELCPQDVVQEHVRALRRGAASGSDDEVVDGEATDVTEESR
jgi:uncharacterized membrane protein YkvA (DUF1232 family)